MTLSLTFDKPGGYNSGEKITATYSGITLNPGTPGTPASQKTVDGTGSAVFDGQTVTTTEHLVLNIPAVAPVPADTVVYNAPVVPGVTFSPPTSTSPVFTATAP